MSRGRPIVVGVDPLHADGGPLVLATELATLTGAAVVEVWGEPPAQALDEAVRSRDAALLVIGASHARVHERLGLHTVAAQALHGAACPVAIAPPGYEAPREGIRRVGAAFVDTKEGRDALHRAAELAVVAGASLHVVTVVPWFDSTGMLTPPAEVAEMAAQRAIEPIGGDLEIHVQVFTGATAELIEHTAELDLLFCGSRGYGPLRAVLAGSVSRALALHAHCPVVVVPRAPRD